MEMALADNVLEDMTLHFNRRYGKEGAATGSGRCIRRVNI